MARPAVRPAEHRRCGWPAPRTPPPPAAEPRPATPSRESLRSVALEVGDALLDVRRDAFLGVLAGEQLGLQLALDGEAVLEGDLGAGLHGALDMAGGHGGLVRRGELAGV